MAELVQTWGALLIAALALLVAIRAEWRVSEVDKATRVRWELVPDPSFEEVLLLRNVGRRPAHAVQVSGTGRAAIRSAPAGLYVVEPDGATRIEFASVADIIGLPDSVTVAWTPRSHAALWGKGRVRRSHVSTADVRHTLLASQRQEPQSE